MSSSSSDSSNSIDSDDFSSDSDSDDCSSKNKRWVPFRKYGRCGKPRNPLLHSACKRGNFQLVKDLINRGYDINKINSHGFSPLMLVCGYNHLEIFKFILRKPSLKITQNDVGHIIIADDIDFTRWWLVISQPNTIDNESLERLQNINEPIHTYDGVLTCDPIGDLNLLNSYNHNRKDTLNKIRQDLGMIEDLFSLVVLNTDGYLTHLSGSKCKKSTKRWFSIVKQLPMELQMLICHRTYGSSKNNIRSEKVGGSLKRVIGCILNFHTFVGMKIIVHYNTSEWILLTDNLVEHREQ